jgi:enoyl-CoA hydratase/carnithine racemase
MELTTIQYEKKGAIAYVTLNRPDKLNAMNNQMHEELGNVWQDFRDDPDLRVAILSGNGKCFSAGADLNERASGTYRYDGKFPDISQTQNVFKPIISAMHGHVVGFGMWISMDADIRIAAEDVTFWLPEPQWGIATIPAAWFPRIMPWAIASELLLMAERVDAQRAYQVGMVNKVVPRDQLMAEAEKAAKRIAELSPVAVQGMKELMVRAAALDYNAVDQLTGLVQNQVMNSEDRKEGVKAFAKREKVDWPGC